MKPIDVVDINIISSRCFEYSFLQLSASPCISESVLMLVFAVADPCFEFECDKPDGGVLWSKTTPQPFMADWPCSRRVLFSSVLHSILST